MFEELKQVNIDHEASLIARRLHGFDHETRCEEELGNTNHDSSTKDYSKNQGFFDGLRKAQTDVFFSFCNEKNENTSSTMCSLDANETPDTSRFPQRSTFGLQNYQPPKNSLFLKPSLADRKQKREIRSETRFRFSDLVNANNRSIYLSRE